MGETRTVIYSILYDEPAVEGEIGTNYRGVKANLHDGQTHLFMTDDVVADFKAAVQFGLASAPEAQQMMSSSVDWFVHDVPGYEFYEDEAVGGSLIRRSAVAA